MAITQVYTRGSMLWVFTDTHPGGLAVNAEAQTACTAHSTPQTLEEDEGATRIYGDAPKDAKLREIDGFLVGHPVESKVYDPKVRVTAWLKDDVDAGKRVGLTGVDSVEQAWERITTFSKNPSRREYVRPMLAVVKWFEMEGEK